MAPALSKNCEFNAPEPALLRFAPGSAQSDPTSDRPVQSGAPPDTAVHKLCTPSVVLRPPDRAHMPDTESYSQPFPLHPGPTEIVISVTSPQGQVFQTCVPRWTNCDVLRARLDGVHGMWQRLSVYSRIFVTEELDQETYLPVQAPESNVARIVAYVVWILVSFTIVGLDMWAQVFYALHEQPESPVIWNKLLLWLLSTLFFTGFFLFLTLPYGRHSPRYYFALTLVGIPIVAIPQALIFAAVGC